LASRWGEKDKNKASRYPHPLMDFLATEGGELLHSRSYYFTKDKIGTFIVQLSGINNGPYNPQLHKIDLAKMYPDYDLNMSLATFVTWPTDYKEALPMAVEVDIAHRLMHQHQGSLSINDCFIVANCCISDLNANFAGEVKLKTRGWHLIEFF
jgi:hypothetical protein